MLPHPHLQILMKQATISLAKTIPFPLLQLIPKCTCLLLTQERLFSEL